MENLNDALDDGLNIYPQMCVCYQVPILRHRDSYKQCSQITLLFPTTWLYNDKFNFTLYIAN